VHLAELKQTVGGASAQAAMLLDAGQEDAAAEVYTLLFARLRAAFVGLPGVRPGWPQLVIVVTHPTTWLPLDALERKAVRRLQIRAATLLDLPEVTCLTCVEDMHTPIRADLAITLARRKARDYRGCCTLHWATCGVLLAAQVSRAFPGYAKALAPMRQAYEAAPPAHVLDEQGISFYALTLRVALEAALMVTA
jgi:hypothetical protein